jgi:hypothetical protein
MREAEKVPETVGHTSSLPAETTGLPFREVALDCAQDGPMASGRRGLG